MSRVPETHCGMSCFIPSSVHGHGAVTCAMPTLGFIVVNGKLPTGASACVAAEKNVDLPTFALPNNPNCIGGAPARFQY